MASRKMRFLCGRTLFLLLWLLIFCMPSWADEEKAKVIRVGYPIQSGFTEITGEGTYSGYTYEYLQEIAQYTNWEYEYVTPEGNLNEQLTVLMEMLENGEIDLMGAMSYSEDLADVYSYSGYSYGTAYNTLAVLENNIKFTEFNYSTFDNMRVAVVNSSGNENSVLNQFAEVNGFHVKQILCATEEEQIALLEAGEADAALRRDVSIDQSDLRVIARFSPQVFYFTLYKGNQDLIVDLNRALEMINTTNPYYTASLYEKYFDSGAGMILSNEEQEYVDQAGTLKVAVLLGKAPFQYRDNQGQLKGISIDILNYITDQTGLRFEVTPFDTMEAYEAGLKAGSFDLVAGVRSDYEMARAENYTLTISFTNVPVMLVMNNKSSAGSGLSGLRAAVENQYVLSEMAPLNLEAQVYGTLEECLNAVYEGEVDYCYGNSYSVQYYTSSKNYKNISTVAQSDSMSKKYCFGIMKPVDITLLSIMNKAIKAIPDDMVNSFLYENAYDPGSMTFVEYAQRNPEQITLGLVAFWLLVLLIILVAMETVRRAKIGRKVLENQRYEQLSELSNEFLYEYDIREKCLKLTERTAVFLGCEKVICHPEKEGEQYPVFCYMTVLESGNREYQCTFPNGTVRWLRFISKIAMDPSGKTWFAVGKLVDIQKEREDMELLESRAQRDSMTKVYNSATSRQMIQAVLEESGNSGGGAMIIMDIDYFKQVNDDMGHYTGDQVLCETADILKNCFRKEDIVGRLGGDEFVIFMKEVTDPEFVRECCREVLESVRSTSVSMHERMITMSIGAAMAGPGIEYDTLYRLADQALYRIKQRGRNGVEVVETV